MQLAREGSGSSRPQICSFLNKSSKFVFQRPHSELKEISILDDLCELKSDSRLCCYVKRCRITRLFFARALVATWLCCPLVAAEEVCGVVAKGLTWPCPMQIAPCSRVRRYVCSPLVCCFTPRMLSLLCYTHLAKAQQQTRLHQHPHPGEDASPKYPHSCPNSVPLPSRWSTDQHPKNAKRSISRLALAAGLRLPSCTCGRTSRCTFPSNRWF